MDTGLVIVLIFAGYALGWYRGVRAFKDALEQEQLRRDRD